VLNQWTDKLAAYLQNKGVKSEEPVGIMLKASLEMIVAMLAILKAGGAYLPIDSDYPGERIKYMLDDSKARILLQDNKNKINTPIVLNIKHLNFEFVSNSEFCVSDLRPSNLAYIIYTSGTTGKPKGVMVEHANVVRLFFNDQFQFDFTERDIWTMFHSYCFDFSVWEMYGALLFGGKLILIHRITARDTKYYLQILKREGVTVLNQTPSAFYRLIEEELQYLDNKSLYLKYVIFGGEALNPSQLKEWKCKYPETRLINMYGITETTVHVTYKELTDEEIDSGKSNIGKPIPTLSTYIMNKNRQLMPIGTTGELCIGGAGVSRGYLNHTGWTTQKFIDNPYKPGETLYRSGDLVRYLDNGDMQYLGRMDHQVKIRGYRIELGEIERSLLNHHEIDEAVVMAREEQVGEKYLCAYVVSKRDIDTEDLRAFLHQSLPEYMLPALFIPLEKLPLTPNGKIDIKALPEPKNILRKKYTPPGNGLERKLVDIWARILNRSSSTIGIHDNFFQLGGHSLKATLMMSKIHKIFDVNIPLTGIFISPTIRELAVYIKEAVKAQYLSIEPTEKKEYYPLSPAQKKFYILNQLESQGNIYHIYDVFVLAGKVDKEKLEKTFKKLILRHDAFRTSFMVVKGEPVQKIHDEVEFNIEYYNLATENTEKKILRIPNHKLQITNKKERSNTAQYPDPKSQELRAKSYIKDFIRPFDLSQAPLLRGGLIKREEENHLFLFDIHHIISDAISFKLTVDEFMKFFAGKDKQLPELMYRYKDYSEWQEKLVQSGEMKRQQEYWTHEFSGPLPVPDLPMDYERPAVQSFEGDNIHFKISLREMLTLKEYAREEEATMFMVVLAVFFVFLYKLSGQEDIIIGTPAAGRRYSELYNIVGVFINTLSLRNYPKEDKSFEQLLGEVRTRALEAFENQDYQFDDLVKKAQVPRDSSRNPIFSVLYSFASEDETGEQREQPPLPGANQTTLQQDAFLNLKKYEYHNYTALLDLILTVTEINHTRELFFNFGYCTKLFKSETIETFIIYFKEIISVVVKNKRVLLKEINISHDLELAKSDIPQITFGF
jgi:amino acid adenylation domain-containing protein